MRLKVSTTMLVVRKEEKEARLKNFIEKDLAARRAAPTGARQDGYSLLAHSAESPAAKALLALAPEAAAHGLEIRIIFMTHDHGLAPARTAGMDVFAGLRCRLATDSRLLDAHEQLVLGQHRVWVGDCMRREPSRRDALENYSEDCATTAVWARRAFERIWSTADPYKVDAAQHAPARDLAILEVALQTAADGLPPAALTLH
jgi:xanthine/CO dehydrogenase XdhC/CoxF family maturation factor